MKSLPALVCTVIASLSSGAAWATPPGGLPPEGSVIPGEWEDMRAQVMSWSLGTPSIEAVLADVVDAVQEYNEVWIYVDDASDEAFVRLSLQTFGVPTTNVFFLHEPVDSMWARDYGPVYMRSPLGEPHIVDSWYYFGREDDDNIPWRIGAQEDVPVHEARFDFEGGNLQSDGHGHCFTTDRIIEENPLLTLPEIEAIFRDLYRCRELTMLQAIPAEITGHIDMFAKLLSPTKWMVGEYPPGDPNKAVLDANASLLAGLTAHDGSSYQVVRMPMPTTEANLAGPAPDHAGVLPAYDDSELSASQAGEIWRTHVNSIIADDLVVVPTYGKGTDAEALAIYEQAMPGYTIVGVDTEPMIDLEGAVHCVVKEVPEYPPYQGLAVDSIQGLTELTGNGDGAVDPGETWEFRVALENRGTATAEGVSARLALNASVSGPVRLLGDTAGFGDIGGGSAVASAATYRIALDESYPCGEAVVLDVLDIVTTGPESPDQPASLQLPVGDETLVIPFQDDFEGGAEGWAHTAISGGLDLWHLQADPGCFAASSPSTSWAFTNDLDCTYATGTRVAGNLTSPTIGGITADSKLYLDYWREVDVCSRFPVEAAKDFFRVKVSDDSFATSVTLLDLSCKNPSHARWLDDGALDLSTFAGSPIAIRFEVDSSDAGGNEYRGVGVDDVLVENRSYACSGFAAPAPGEIGDGEPLRIARSGSNLVVSWDIGCNAGYDTDYAVYRGTIDSLRTGTYDHAPVTCTDLDSDLEETVTDDGGSYYFLVVPHDGAAEGGYGAGSPGPRPPAAPACYPAGGGTCS